MGHKIDCMGFKLPVLIGNGWDPMDFPGPLSTFRIISIGVHSISGNDLQLRVSTIVQVPSMHV